MAKLIKLSTTTDQNRLGNSFNCLSDEDIMIEANSRISLLNCQISSGILKDYVVNGTDTIDGQVGEIWGFLDLVATTQGAADPNRRRLLLRNGNYNITTLCAEMRKSILDALVSCSAGGYPAQTSNTLPMPLNSPDFELCVDVYVNKDNKIQIDYNSKPIITTSAITYTNKKQGILVDQSGQVSFDSGSAPLTEIAIDPTKNTGSFQNITVFTQGTVVGKVVVNDVVTLLAYQYPTIAPCAYVIKSITLAGSNLDSNISLNDADADETNLTVYSNAQLDDRGFKAGDAVMLDDGASTPTVQSPNLITGTIASVDLEFTNPNYEIQQYPSIDADIFSESFTLPAQKLIENSVLNYTFEVECDPTETITNQYFYLDVYQSADPNSRSSIIVGQILNQKASATVGNSIITVQAATIPGKDLRQLSGFLPKFGAELVLVSDFLTKTSPGSGDFTSYLPQGVKYWVVDSGTQFPLFRVLINTLFPVSADQIRVKLNLTTPFEIYNNVAVLNGIQALAYILSVYGDLWNSFYLVPAYNLISSTVFDPANVDIAANDSVVFADNGVDLNTGKAFGGGSINTILQNDPNVITIGGDDYTGYFIEFDYADTKLEYLNNQRIIASIETATTLTIFKNSLEQRLKFVLSAVSDATKIPLATRIWEGTEISVSYELNLTRNGASTSGWTLNKFSDLVKGDISPKYGDAYAFALCDEICNQGPGRAIFQIQALPTTASGADVGIISVDNINFAALDSSTAKIRVALVRSSGGGYRYALYYNGSQVSLGAGSNISALAGDRIVIQWNCGYGYTYDPVGKKSRGDRKFTRADGSLNDAKQYPNLYLDQVEDQQNGPTSATRELMRNNVSFAVMRSQSLDYQYIGAPVGNDTAGNNAGSTYPYTPLANPFQRRIKWDTMGNYAPYIRPGTGGVFRMLELTGNPLTITDNNGIKTPFDGTNYIYHPDLHSVDLDIQSNNATKYTDPANSFQLTLGVPRLQKLMGFSELTYFRQGASGSITANKSYLEAFLPENILVMLDTAPSISTYDCGQTQGKRRQIVCCAINTQSLTGDINIEPSNLYRISLGNKTPINSRKFTVSFETFYGEQIILSNAKATVNLLVEPPE
jgi:hypothetical protein